MCTSVEGVSRQTDRQTDMSIVSTSLRCVHQRQPHVHPPPPSTQESPDQKTYYWKVHGKWDALLKGAEHIGLRMPISVSRRGTSWCGGKQWTAYAARF